ncbi:GNAT family N-acetyltransferase [Verminephrobacter aporrectodeae subsp. tuberculatae]|uniref:GNAT family N-acetyltransferase n=1 Tax=Verminephrobacter aporrectodeae TaxID=1110389 RepID=UPI0002378570|nr:GNAT family N-acetyltransferase [Verminephrobacter aporrectodeae]MCW8164699.1 GNAT family N-acetyltransferase [Verminephrobacter aporrectodeae subsp. tuberculatae]MCW8169367.1 GNAT family N-acetyltransferase [Verminephrobacter aporrectodeae subsp. tuberculatae]MCW8206976.1 GNAT family N-acetyltransferase [Verminephrobacter aporrectodeae subsp. tuberculatae]
MQRLIPASEPGVWRQALAPLGALDASYLPQYHLAYALRVPHSRPLLWHFSCAGQHFLYPFLLTPVVLGSVTTPYFDVSSVYGYTGPIASTADSRFIADAWTAFDAYTARQRVIAEFVRFSPFNGNQGLAHPQSCVLANRTLAVSRLPTSRAALLQSLSAKTRNMLRKAGQAGLVARELPLPQCLPQFRALYDATMVRNQVPEFFLYDDAYWQQLLALGSQGLRLFGSFAGARLVAAAMAVVDGASGLYHLGASLNECAPPGAGNLSLFALSCGLMESGVEFLNMTGGRTTDPNDALLLFKRSNANGTAIFHIGKRIVDPLAYNAVATQWQQLQGSPPNTGKIVFWRP